MKNKMLVSPLLLSVILLMLCCSNGPAAWASASTTTSLAVTAGGSAITTVPSGTAVTLTATVTASGAPVTAGTVNFCDASVAYCTDLRLLGSAQLTSAGTATVKLVPAIGAHSYKAVFVATSSDNGSSSAVSSLQVTGKFPTTTSNLVVNPDPASHTYSLAATVSPNGNPPGLVAPSGAVSFEDANNGNAVLATANLAAGTSGLNWTTSQTMFSETPQFLLKADFNLDGIPDFVTLDESENTLTIFLGKGDGTFSKVATMPSVGGFKTLVNSLAIGDFNHDGKPDIATYESNNLEVAFNTEIVVLLGNGDGTFTQAPITVVSDSSGLEGSVAVGDFNSDGLLDLVITDENNNAATILTGNGDGTFTPAASTTVTRPAQVVVGDFNNDGKADLAVGSNSNSIVVLLGNGDGTFTTASNPPAVSSVSFFVAADFNGDGKLDLAALNSSTTITVLLGNGDGTFTAAASSTTTFAPLQLTFGDFNGDSKVDLAVSNGFHSNSVSILLGDGTGTFAEASIRAATVAAPIYLVSADWNGDGITDLADEDANSNITVLLAHPAPASTAAASGITLPTTAKVFAHYPGDSVYNTSDSATVTPPPFLGFLTLSTNNLNFGSVAVNTNSDAKPVTLKNTGNAVLTFNSIGISGAVSPDGWRTMYATSNNCGSTLAVNASCVIKLRFSPLSAGITSGTLTIQSNASNGQQNVSLFGIGGGSSISLSQNRVEFGNQAVGASSAVQQVTLTNTDTVSVNISSIWWNGAPAGTFAVSSTCGATLAPSASCAVHMRFNPQATGLFRSVVYITNSSTDTPLQIGMAGTGVTP